MKKKSKIEPISEMNLIRFLLNNAAYRSEVFSNIKRNMFKSDLCAEVFDTIYNYYTRFQKMPLDNIEILILNNELKQDKKIIDEKLAIVRCDKNNYNLSDIDPFLQSTEVWWKNRTFALMALDCATQYKSIEKNGFDTSSIDEKLKEVQTFSFGKDEMLDWHNDGTMKEIYDDPEIRQKFLSNIWNRSTGGGMPKKCLFVIMGASGAGKSRLLHSLACDHMRENKKNIVLYFSLEMTKKDIAQRTEANFFNMPVKKCKQMFHENNDEWSIRRERFRNKYGKIIVDDKSDHTPASIRAKIETMIQKDLAPTMVIVDYIGLVKSGINSDNMYLNGSTVSKALLSMSKDFEIPVLAAVQPNRKGAEQMMNGKQTDQNGVSESKAIFDDSDIFVSLNMTHEEEENGRQRISIIKNRHHNRKETIIGELHPEIYKVDFLEFDKGGDSENETVYNENNDTNKFDNSCDNLPF